MTVTSRRGFLLTWAVALAQAGRLVGQQDSLQAQGERGALRDPSAAGAPRAPSTDRDNDPLVVGVEHRLRCTCGCNLDIYTCRTTDFTCGVSPRLHREVLALQDRGKSAQQIVDAFVVKYGEQMLMAPKPVGFNLAGYLVPGVVLLSAGAILTLILRRRILARPDPATPGAPAAPAASPDELARLERELTELERS